MEKLLRENKLIQERLADSADLPSFNQASMAAEEHLAAFVNSFLEHDAIARELLSPSNRILFDAGYRPTIGVPHDPEAGGERFGDVRSYYTRKLHLDLSAIRPLDQASFDSFLRQLGRDSGQTLECSADPTIKYGLKVDGPFNFEEELRKIPEGPARESFKRCWLNDDILGTELRMLGWIHLELFGVPYVFSEKDP